MYDAGINYTNNILILIKLDLCNKDIIIKKCVLCLFDLVQVIQHKSYINEKRITHFIVYDNIHYCKFKIFIIKFRWFLQICIFIHTGLLNCMICVRLAQPVHGCEVK